jgi:probable O-glycosylation ligase (exosortase A-associated)
MRDIVVTAIVFGLLPFILKRPHVGILTWSWLSYMNPHRLTWGFAYSFPFAQLVAIVTLVSILFSKEPKRIPMTGLTTLWILFLIWISITTVFSLSDYSIIQYEKVMKIQIVTFLTIMLINTKEKLNALIWVIVLSIGFYGIKGGIFTLKTLGNFRVWGPAGTFIEDNNELALSTVMIMPLFYYLYLQAHNVWIKRGIILSLLLMTVSVLGSYSRGSFLAIAVMGVYLWWKTPGKFISGIITVVLAVLVFSFMPQQWHDRMDTIVHYEEDGSAMGRIDAWKMSVNLANDRLTGAGLSAWSPVLYRMYSDNPATWDSSRAAHSIYFSVLGEHGWIGLMLFVTILITAWWNARWIIRQSRGVEELKWLADLGKVIQVSLLVYFVGGTFYSLAYFDLPWHIVSMLIIGRMLVKKQQEDARKALSATPAELPTGELRLGPNGQSR